MQRVSQMLWNLDSYQYAIIFNILNVICVDIICLIVVFFSFSVQRSLLALQTLNPFYFNSSHYGVYFVHTSQLVYL